MQEQVKQERAAAINRLHALYVPMGILGGICAHQARFHNRYARGGDYGDSGR
ncbi:MAG: hypothetical protein LBU25_02975 [Treponema sp.]|nr:hypothetical protein [Treponema sp.]